jgi:hypothetical protein
MAKTASTAPMHGDILTVHEEDRPRRTEPGRTFRVEAKDEASSNMLLASLSLLDRLWTEKSAEVRERHMEELVDFLAEQMLKPSNVELDMARRLAERHARILNEFGWYTAEQLADANGSQAANRSALVDNWRKRRQVFAVPHPDRTARDRDVYLGFQFEDHRPVKAVHDVLEVFGDRRSSWKLALWFTSNNGWLPRSVRPVDLLDSDPEAVIAAAQRDAAGSAA